MKIGIFGGTFDPIHNGHMIMAEVALEKYKLDKMIFIPCYIPPHKGGRKITAPSDRLAMTRLAVRNNKKFSVSDVEIKRGGKSYSINTLRYLKDKLGRSNKLFFIIGSDSLKEFNTWVEPDELLKICSFIVFERPEFPLKGIVSRLGRRKKYFSRLIDEFPIGVSSTEIRKRVRSQRTIAYFVPRAVENYIKKKKLYKK